VPSRHY